MSKGDEKQGEAEKSRNRERSKKQRKTQIHSLMNEKRTEYKSLSANTRAKGVKSRASE